MNTDLDQRRGDFGRFHHPRRPAQRRADDNRRQTSRDVAGQTHAGGPTDQYQRQRHEGDPRHVPGLKRWTHGDEGD